MILEFNNSDKYLIKSIGDQFTISLEIELETDDLYEKSKMDKNSFIEIIKKNCNNYIKDNKQETAKYITYIDDLISQLLIDEDEEDGNDDYNLDVINDYIDSTNDKFEKDLYRVIYADYLTYWCSDNIEYLTKKVNEKLPNFYNKWNSILKFELDNTLNRGIEFSPKKYLNSIDETLEFIDDFYDEFNHQEYWYMSERTGIHINVGLKEQSEWNIVKGILMISDEGEKSFIFKDMEWREKSLYSKSFMPQLKKDIESKREKIMKKSQFSDLKKLENYFSRFILSKLKKHGYKNYGFNITRINDLNYIEFRYPGGEIPKQVLIDKLYYFCYIVKLMTDKSYKRKQYLKKLYKFITNL